ncbi:DUF4823 domain-containing protein [Methyloglobulus sp.]|uniref:DUF4823 domain-containing protein n=1 Tax=Methyloglobulus sp. TaxID=2518622 RepID=UPI0032B853DA
MRFISLVILVVTLSGCTATYKQNILAEPSAKLTRGKSVIISTPANGAYDSEEYSASGKMTALAIRAAFVRFSNTVTVIPDCKDIACLKSGQSASFDYYVIPEILHWEERATEWSGLPDQIEVKVSIYDGQNLKELSSAIISGKSKWATFGGDHPQDLLPEPLNKYVESLY